MDIADLKAKMEAAEKLLRYMEEIEIPPTVKKAAKEKWEASADARLALVGKIAYPAAQQRIDSQRAIRLKDVIALLRELEEEQIDADVSGPLDVIADAFTSSYQLAFVTAKLVFELVRNWDAAQEIIVNVVLNFLRVAAAAEIAKRLKAIFKLRDDYVDSARELALPQLIRTRHVRVKRSRVDEAARKAARLAGDSK